MWDAVQEYQEILRFIIMIIIIKRFKCHEYDYQTHDTYTIGHGLHVPKTKDY